MKNLKTVLNVCIIVVIACVVLFICWKMAKVFEKITSPQTQTGIIEIDNDSNYLLIKHENSQESYCIRLGDTINYQYENGVIVIQSATRCRD